MAVTIGSVTEGNANAEEIKNNSPDSELYEKNKKYLQGSLVKFNDKIYLAKRNVPSDVDLDNPYYWEIFMDAADSKRVDELFEKTGNLDELETESKDNLVTAINEVGSIQPDWAQNDETAKDYIKNRTHWIEEKTVLEETTFTIEESDDSFVLGNFPVTLSAGDICTVVYDGKTYTCTVFEFGTDIAGIGCDAFEIAFQKQPDGLYAITIGAYAGEHTISILQTTYHTIPDEFIPWEESPTATSVLYTAQSLTEEQKVQARQNIGAQDLYNCVQTNKENILGDNGSIISNSSRGNSLTISNGVIEQKNSNQNTISLGDAKVVFSHDSDGSSSTKGNGTFTMYGRKGEEYFKFKGTNGDVRVNGIATPTLQNDAVNKGYVDSQIATIEIPTVPTNVSAFTNDAGYLTEHQSLADYALKSEIPSPYSLPTASATELGGVKADSSEATDTQPVRIGVDGKLYTAPGGKTPNITIGNVETLDAGQNATASITGESPDLTLNLGIPKGADGQPGTDGKTAYQYAQDGGYTGTETEFAAKLAQEIPEALPNPNALTFTGAVNATYDGSTAVSVEIPSGESGGTDISLGLTSAAVGQIIKVKAIDESGKPTAWEAVDLPKPDEYVVLFHKTFETAVANTDEWGGESHKYTYRHFWTVDTYGNAVYADGIFFRIHVPAQTDNIVNSGELSVRVGQRAVTSWMSWSADEAKPYIGWSSFVSTTGQEVWAEQNFDLREQIFSGTRVTNQKDIGNFQSANQVIAVPFSYALGLLNIEYLSGVQVDLVSGSLPAGTEILIYARKYDANKIKNIPKWGAT